MIYILKKIILLLQGLVKLLEADAEKSKNKNLMLPLNIEEMIREVAIEFNVSPNLAVKVARCESNLEPSAININPKGSEDRGLYQWNSYWHPEVTDQMAYDPVTATRLFCKAVKEDHLSWWNASRGCWSK